MDIDEKEPVVLKKIGRPKLEPVEKKPAVNKGGRPKMVREVSVISQDDLKEIEAIDTEIEIPKVEHKVNEIPVEIKSAAPPVVVEKPKVVIKEEPKVIDKPVEKPKVFIDKRPKWRKIPNTGIHYMPDGTKVESGQVIKAWPDEITAPDKFIALDSVRNFKPNPATAFTVVPMDDGFNVKDGQGRFVSDRPLTEKEAQSFLDDTGSQEEVD